MSHASKGGKRARAKGVLITALPALSVLGALPLGAQPAGSAFTYQGRLTDNGTAATGAFDFQCALYTAATGGAQVGPTLTINDAAVANGLFTVTLDFGALAFAGSARFLQVGVRPGASTGAYTLLGARQEIKPAPHTVFAQAAPWAGLTGMPAGFADGVDNDSGGDITGVTVGTGLTGGGSAGAVSIGIDYPALTLNHNHFGQTWNGSQGWGLTVNNSAVNGAGLRASATAASGFGVGVFALSDAENGVGVDGGTSGAYSTGVRGVAGGSNSRGVFGWALATQGPTVGVYGEVNSTAEGAAGVRGVATATEGRTTGVYGETKSVGTVPFPEEASAAAIRGVATATRGYASAIIAVARGNGHALYALSVPPGATAVNALGGDNGTGLLGQAYGTAGRGVWGVSNLSATAYAGYFSGSVSVSGTLSKGAGSFKIDHPLDPENKYLYHSFVESPDMKNVYDGVVVTDADGSATIELPEWFEALNRDFRYQLTVHDEGDTTGFVQVKVVRKVSANRFSIRTSEARTEVSWQVTGIRKDAYAEKHRIPVEESKPDGERGRYIHPADWGQPPERGVDWPLLQRHLRRPPAENREN